MKHRAATLTLVCCLLVVTWAGCARNPHLQRLDDISTAVRHISVQLEKTGEHSVLVLPETTEKRIAGIEQRLDDLERKTLPEPCADDEPYKVQKPGA